MALRDVREADAGVRAMGRIVLILVLLFVALLCVLVALSMDSSQATRTVDEIADDMDDPTKPIGCVSILMTVVFGALVLLGLMWFVYGYLGAKPSDAPSLPWMVKDSSPGK